MQKPVDVIYLDYAKAFDSVVHNNTDYPAYGVCDMVLQLAQGFSPRCKN